LLKGDRLQLNSQTRCDAISDFTHTLQRGNQPTTPNHNWVRFAKISETPDQVSAAKVGLVLSKSEKIGFVLPKSIWSS
jgi:hypothetical protein